MTERFRLNMEVKCAASKDQRRANADYSKSLGYPVALPSPLNGRKLAVVGGGPSVADHLDELKNWPGDIWAISDAAGWLLERGIKSTLLTADPTRWKGEGRLEKMTGGIDKAILSSICHPELFDALKGADITIFHMDPDIGEDDLVNGGSTTASRTPFLALRLGYADVSYFGCEGCFSDQTHVYEKRRDERNDLTITASGEEYRTTLQLMWQCECLAEVLRAFPAIFKNRSGGLLDAMIQDPEWGIVWMSDFLEEYTPPAEEFVVFDFDPPPSGPLLFQ